MEQLNSNNESTILLINIAFILFSYLYVYPRFVKDDLQKLTKFDIFSSLFALGVVGFFFFGDERSFDFILFETNWWVFCILSYFVLELPFIFYYIKKWDIDII